MGSDVTSQNIFDLLDDENEDPQLLAAAASKAQKVKETKKEPAKPAQDNAQAPAARAAEPAGGRGDGGRGGRVGDARGRGRGRSDGGRVGRGGRSGYDRPYSTEESPIENGGFDSSAPSLRGRGGRGAPRGGAPGGPRGRGRGRYGDYEGRPARREFERHDGTGRGHEGIKRGGAGKGNWGAEGETTAEEADQHVVQQFEAPVDEKAENVDATIPAEEVLTAEAEEPSPAVEEVEEQKELTLDEYEALLAEKKQSLNKQKEVAQVDMNQFKGMAAYVRKVDEEDDVKFEVSKKYESKAPKEKARKEVVTVETGFKVGDEPSRGGRGARGGRRGGRDGYRGRDVDAGGFRGRGEGESGGYRPEGRGEGRGEGGGYRGESGGYRGRAIGRGRGYGGYGGRGGRGGDQVTGLAIDDQSAFPSLG